MARSNFYRLNYNNSHQLDEWSQSGRLPAQAHELEAKVRIGNYVLAAKFDATFGIGEVRAVGRVSKIGKEVELDWRSARFDLHPSNQGQRFWLQDHFNFDAGVSVRYELERRCSEIFPDAVVVKGNQTRPTASPKAGHVYVIKSPHGYKIGKSKQLRDTPVFPNTLEAAVTLRNRVDPWGCLHAVDARGALLGNRGKLHNEQRQIVRDWQRLPWVTCALEFKGRRREVFGPATYSELFFLDEATAFAAGHRPCATCRRQRYDEFKATWLAANGPHFPLTTASIEAIDKVLHAERLDRSGAKVTFEALLHDMPLGAMVEINGESFLVWHRGLKRWSFTGYSAPQQQPSPSTRVRVLTPESVVRTFAGGYRPAVHESASR